MHRSTWFAIGTAIFAFSGNAFAADAWLQEVSNLRGIELGANAYAIYKECPRKDGTFDGYWPEYDPAYPSEFKDVPCYKIVKDRPVIEDTKLLKIDNLTFIKGAGRSAVVTLVNDQIESIEVKFLNSHFEQFKAAMIEKYGGPSKEGTKSFQNAFGQTFLGGALNWNGKSVALSLDENRSGDKDWGYIAMSSRTYQAKLNEWFSKKKDSIKTGL